MLYITSHTQVHYKAINNNTGLIDCKFNIPKVVMNCIGSGQFYYFLRRSFLLLIILYYHAINLSINANFVVEQQFLAYPEPEINDNSVSIIQEIIQIKYSVPYLPLICLKGPSKANWFEINKKKKKNVLSLRFLHNVF